MKFLWPAECRKRDVKNAKCESAENAENVENACIKLFIVSAARNANAAKYCIKSSLSLTSPSRPRSLLQVYCPSGRHFVWPARILLICQRKSQKKVAFVFRCACLLLLLLPHLLTSAILRRRSSPLSLCACLCRACCWCWLK